MGKYKYIIFFILWTFLPKMCNAEDFVLSDVIREAREAQMRLAKTQIQENEEKTKIQTKEQIQSNSLQSAAEKLNNEEIMSEQ